MQNLCLKFIAFFFLCIFCSKLVANDSSAANYQTKFEGIDDPATLSLLKANSQLVNLQESPPPTEAALRRRGESDTPNLLKTLHSLAFYQAKVDVTYENSPGFTTVKIKIDTGPVYSLASFKILPAETEEAASCLFPLNSVLPKDLGITLNSPAYPKSILDAEEILIKFLEKQGYPLAKLFKREVIADQATKSISVIIYVDPGPLATFGETTIIGQKHVRDVFFCRKIAWQKGCLYNPEQVCRTLNELESSGLFNSITISHDEEALEDGSLPMHITVHEAKHRSIGFGLNYDTDLGPGINAEWEHRNIRGMGEKLSFVTNIWYKKKEGTLRYIKPDFLCPKQDLIWTAEVLNEETRGFDESSASLSSVIERQYTDNIRFSYGGMFKRLRNYHSDDNGSFNLIKAPLQYMWHKTNSLLDPTEGSILHIKSTPTWQTLQPRSAYSINTLTSSVYLPLRADKRLVLAGKATLGSIWGASRHKIPPSERFYAGSDNLLRGYRYLSVSPLNDHNKPIGGRSMMIYSLEARVRATESFGFVGFWDIGNVYESTLPRLDHKQLQSVGLGVRYHTPVGPLRLDVAFPLNPRPHIDNRFQIYFSIGQAF